MTEDDFLAAVAAAPDDDTPRLAYADWLDDAGRARRAEFIRVGCEVAYKERLPRGQQDKFVGLWKRQEELLEYYLADIIGPLAGAVEPLACEFDRGFLVEVTVPVEVFLTDGADIAALRPVPRVRVTGVGGALNAFMRAPHLECVTAISGTVEGIVETLPDLTAGDIAVVTAALARLTRLRVMNLENCGVHDAALDVLVRFAPPNLEDLDLENNLVTVAGVQALLDSPLARRLKKLALSRNRLTDQTAFELADRWPRDGVLERLNLKFLDIGSAGHAALTARFGGKVDLF